MKVNKKQIQFELPVYGLGRIGTLNAALHATYELTDHLGNVRALFGKGADGKVQFEGYTDYYSGVYPAQSGSMAMPGRQFVLSNRYRFGYQGQFAEKDEETGLDHFEARDYDSRIGRWLNPDPNKSHWSPYLAMGNNPTMYGDPDGRDIVVLLDMQGAYGNGHMGMLIGNDKDGWFYYSKNDAKYDLFGPSVEPSKGTKKYNSIHHFFKEENKSNENGETHYDAGLRYSTTQEQDNAMKQEAYKQVTSWYWLLAKDCQASVLNAMKRGGMKEGFARYAFAPNYQWSAMRLFGGERVRIPRIVVGDLSVNGMGDQINEVGDRINP